MQPFNWNMDHFKFNFLSQGQLGSLSISKMLLAMSNSLVTIFLHLLLQLSAEIVLIPVGPHHPSEFQMTLCGGGEYRYFLELHCAINIE